MTKPDGVQRFTISGALTQWKPTVMVAAEDYDRLAEEVGRLRAFHACYAIYGGLPYQIPPGKEVAEKWAAVPMPDQALTKGDLDG